VSVRVVVDELRATEASAQLQRSHQRVFCPAPGCNEELRRNNVASHVRTQHPTAIVVEMNTAKRGLPPPTEEQLRASKRAFGAWLQPAAAPRADGGGADAAAQCAGAAGGDASEELTTHAPAEAAPPSPPPAEPPAQGNAHPAAAAAGDRAGAAQLAALTAALVALRAENSALRASFAAQHAELPQCCAAAVLAAQADAAKEAKEAAATAKIKGDTLRASRGISRTRPLAGSAASTA
jgi:hypothetical protein